MHGFTCDVVVNFLMGTISISWAMDGGQRATLRCGPMRHHAPSAARLMLLLHDVLLTRQLHYVFSRVPCRYWCEHVRREGAVVLGSFWC